MPVNSKGLNIGNGMILPLEAVTESIAILAVKRAGKSNAAVVMAEEMSRNNLHWIAIDPKGDWWGMRSSQDGKGPGLPIVIFGGQHGDVPLEPTSGQMIADLIVDRRVSCVLDVSRMESDAAKHRFLTAFGERLFQRKDHNQEPTHVFLEEADDYIPQQPFPDQKKLINVMARIVKQGGNRGLGVTIISQRSAVVNKNVLTQVGTMIALRTTSPQDRKAIKEWMSFHGENAQVIEDLPSLANGEAWLWSPSWLSITKKFQFHRRSTFDSGSTPKVGGSRLAPATLADINIEAIKIQMIETVKRAEENDPAKLKAKVAELTRQLSTASKSQVLPVKPDHSQEQITALQAEIDGLKGAYAACYADRNQRLSEIEEAARSVNGNAASLVESIKALSIRIAQARAFDGLRAPTKITANTTIRKVRGIPYPQAVVVQATPAPQSNGGSVDSRSSGPQKILNILAEFEAVGVSELKKGGVGGLVGVKASGSTLRGWFADLSKDQLIRYPRPGWVCLTESGRNQGSPRETPLTLAEFHTRWKNTVREICGTGPAIILEIVLKHPGQVFSKSDIAEMMGVEAGGSTMRAHFADLSNVGAVIYPHKGQVQASDLLFPEGLA